ncbi:LacI family DNA-binding transcriptional regulator [Paraburkholderia sp. B3]|uniref:LacI family DNA-binding transcriptional regulator n=1 Tax=Paraburkholderia sp. B3 TaxID=3134791 RepID=UPI003982BF43
MAKSPSRRKRSARFVEIAEEAGVCTATVDRVLNERGSVSAATRTKVVEAARRLGVPRVLPEVRHGLVHLDILLPRNSTPFHRRLALALHRSIQMLDRRVIVHRAALPEDDEALILDAILYPPYRRHGLIITAHDTPPVRKALDTVVAAGEPIVTLATDIGGIDRVHYAGIDNYRAGRAAGHFIGRMAQGPGRVVVLCNALQYRSHVDRTRGCRDAIGERFPGLVCDPASVETHDDPDQCYLAILRALKKHRDVVALYNSGAGSTGIDAALHKLGVAGKIVWVGHEISDEHRRYIEDGTMDLAIDQDPDGQAISALQHLLHACGVVDEAPPAEGNEFRLYMSENLRKTGYLPES